MRWLTRIARLFPVFVIARRNVSRAKGRSLLAAAAILIGVVAIGTIGAGGAAFKQSQLNTIQEQGATNVFVTPGVDKEPRSFDAEDLKEIQATVGEAGVVATRSASMEYVQRPGRRESLSVTYIDDPRALYQVETGDISPNWRRSVVLSGAFAEETGLEPGDRLTVVRTDTEADTEERESYPVTAVLAPSSAFSVDDAYLPITVADSDQYEQVQITTGSTDAAAATAKRLRQRFNQRKDLLLVFELTSLLRLFRTIVNGINVFLTGLGAISLLVAGVSITNTMLMAVIKRKEEIGVLRSVGYSRRDIVRILLTEAALIGGIGAGVGLILAILFSAVANLLFLGNPLAFSPTALLYLGGAAAFGLGTSLIAGAYPAWRAANLRPVEALRD